MEPPLSSYARWKKARFFSPFCKESDAILDVGSGSGWWGKSLKSRGFLHVTGIDSVAPAAISGDIRDWQKLGMAPSSFDVVTAFEVVEHVDCIDSIRSILRPGGLLFVTTPIPSRDWILNILEALGLSQLRTSPHSHLADVRSLPGFTTLSYRRIAGLAQWGVYQKNV